MHDYRLLTFLLLLAVFDSACSKSQSNPIAKDLSNGEPERVKFSQSSPGIECYDFVEVTINVLRPVVRNPFTASSF